MSDWEDEVEQLIRTKGEALGVNAISKALDIPLSTMQKRLEKSRFVKTENRKWDIPENIHNNAFTGTSSNINAVLATQAASVENLLEMLQSNMSTLTTMIKASNNIAPVASNNGQSTPKNDKKLQSVLDNLKLVPGLIKEHKARIPDDYHELLDNTEWLDMFIQLGRVGINVVLDNINAIILGDAEYLTDEALKLVESYQKP